MEEGAAVVVDLVVVGVTVVCPPLDEDCRDFLVKFLLNLKIHHGTYQAGTRAIQGRSRDGVAGHSLGGSSIEVDGHCQLLIRIYCMSMVDC